MASRREYEMLFQLNAQLGGSYNSTFRNAQGAIASMQKEIAALSKTQSDISAYQKQQGAVEASQKKLEMLQQQYDNIQKEMAETGSYSSALENKLLTKQQQIDKTTASLSDQTAKLEHMRTALADAGVNTADLTGETARLGEQIDNVRTRQEEAADEANNFGSTASAAFGAVGQAIVAAGIAVALKEIADYYAVCIQASMEFESAMTGVAKTTDLTKDELLVMGEEIKSLSTDIPITTSELAGLGEVAGQLGIAKENLLDFSTVMSMLATATTMTADEGAILLAQFANITQMDPSYYSNLASTIVSLGNNYATTEQRITEMSQGIAASASLAGMSEADMVALSAAVTSLGIETQAGSTSMSRLISTLMTAVETGDNLNEFAQIANMSAEEFSQAWGNNAVEALQTFVVGLTDTQRNGKSATVALTELGITETRMQRMVLSLANSGDLLNRTLATSSQAWSENTALTAEAELRYATTQSQLTMMQNSYNNLKVAIGDNFTPVLSELYGVATDVLGSVTEFVQKNPVLVKAITTFVVVMGTAVAGITAYIAVAKIATLVSAALTAAIPGVNVIMAVVAGVAALTAGIVALSSATSEEEREVRALTASSREQYQRLQQLNSEYEIAKEQYGETSDEALTLRYEVDELTESYEANKQTLEEFIAKSNALIESHGQIISGYKEATASINDEEQGALALILKLEELSNKTYLTTVEQEQMKAAVDALNESVPGLALNYNDVTDSLNMSIESMKQMVKAQAEQERQAENYRAWVDLTKEELILSQQLAQAQENLRIRRDELTKAGYNVDAPLIGWSTDLDDYVDEVEKLEMAYGEAQVALAEMTAQAEEYEAAQKAAAEGGQDISAVMLDISKSAKELADAYKEAYDAALESIQGQYELWDEAASIVATSAGTINSNLESQINYWQQYNDNLAALSERSSDIQGLSDLIASFADGSSDSVNAISGMANASDEDLRSMVANWQKLQEEQKVAAGSLAEIETEFETSMNNLQQELEGAIADMNLSEEAAESAKQTMQGFADGAINMMPTVQSAYRRIAQAAIAAIDAELDIQSPSRVMMEKAEMTWAGYINETKAMEPEVASAMASASMAGVEAFSAEEAQAATLSSQFMRYIRSLWSNNESVAAQPGFSNGGSHIILNLSPSYNISGMSNTSDLTLALREASRDLKDYILEVLEDHEIDMKRRAFA